MESTGVATSTNAAYGLMKQADIERHEYESVDQIYPSPLMSGKEKGEARGIFT